MDATTSPSFPITILCAHPRCGNPTLLAEST